MSTRTKSEGKNVSTFCRIRPGFENAPLQYQITPSSEESGKAETIDFLRPSGYHEAVSAKTRRSQEYTFNQVFDENASQDDLFKNVGKPVIENVLNGYNGTIFAYGQTATGKTFTVMGEELEYEKADEWGLIPRALDYIFAELEATNHNFEVTISFLEIYKESMQDLLGRQQHVFKKHTYETKNKVVCKMNDDSVRLEGLSLRKVPNSKESMEVFLEGFQARAVAETYANNKSSRSHAVFTLYITREDDTGVLESRLHFVDLAGSERVSKDHLESSELVAEAKEINRSLLFLHKVIKSIASNKKPETFRNTMITRILRDSLIGNSMTSLIATISIEEQNIDETLSTCDFAQSVSKIKTKPVMNKTEDLNMIIANLQAENKRLTDRLNELEHLKESTDDQEPTDDEKMNLKKLVQEYYNSEDPDWTLQVEKQNSRAQYCFAELKSLGKADKSDVAPELKHEPLTEERMRSLNALVDKFIAQPDPKAALELGDNPAEAQFCLMRLKQIVKEFDERPKKKKGCC